MRIASSNAPITIDFRKVGPRQIVDSQAADSQATSPAPGLPARKSTNPKLDQLNEMVQTATKMQTIRKDSTIPESVKAALLKPLQAANDSALAQATMEAEQEKKADIIDASTADAEAIRKAGEAIADSAQEKAQEQEAAASAPTDGSTSASPDGPSADVKAAAPAKQDKASAAPDTKAPEYSAPSSEASLGTQLDVYA